MFGDMRALRSHVTTDTRSAMRSSFSTAAMPAVFGDDRCQRMQKLHPGWPRRDLGKQHRDITFDNYRTIATCRLAWRFQDDLGVVFESWSMSGGAPDQSD
jgi:hypothetical protein